MLGRDFEDEVRSRSVFELACNPIGYFGKMNSTLGSVVPLAMFLIMTPIKIKMTSTWREQFTISHNLKKLKTTTKYSPKISDDEGDVQTNTNLFVDDLASLSALSEESRIQYNHNSRIILFCTKSNRFTK